MADQISKPLDQVRRELLAEFDDAERESYIHLVDWLRKSDVVSHALQVGDTAPDFLLPDENGRLHSSKDLRDEGPLVVSFYRGGWCPFCKAELRALQAITADLNRLKAKVVVLSPDTRDLPRQLKQQLGLDLTMLADVDYGVATTYGIVFRVPDETRAHYADFGYDLGHRHGSTEWMLPIPATYLIDQDGVVRGAFIEPDFTIRQEPSDILARVGQLAESRAGDDSASDD
jgi:peroxiredoxin